VTEGRRRPEVTAPLTQRKSGPRAKCWSRWQRSIRREDHAAIGDHPEHSWRPPPNVPPQQNSPNASCVRGGLIRNSHRLQSNGPGPGPILKQRSNLSQILGCRLGQLPRLQLLQRPQLAVGQRPGIGLEDLPQAAQEYQRCYHYRQEDRDAHRTSHNP